MSMLELWQNLGDMTTGAAIGVVCLYFYNQMAVRFLEARAEWYEFMQTMIDRYDVRTVQAVEASTKAANEMHALRGRVQELMGRLETRLTTIENRMRGGSHE